MKSSQLNPIILYAPFVKKKKKRKNDKDGLMGSKVIRNLDHRCLLNIIHSSVIKFYVD